jgi:CPA2 family monovalent cation:H+ antiporter-2
MQDLLSLSVTLVAAGAIAAGLCARLRMPTLLGYLAAGSVLGPSIGNVVQPSEALNFLAHIGVVFLMFMVGLEFSVTELWATRWQALTAGGLQFTSNMLAFGLVFRH